MDINNVNSDENKDIVDLQKHVVKMRKVYINKISKYFEQNSNIEVKLLEKKTFKTDDSPQIKQFHFDQNLLDDFDNTVIDNQRVNRLKSKIRNLKKIVDQNTKVQNCDIFIKTSE